MQLFFLKLREVRCLRSVKLPFWMISIWFPIKLIEFSCLICWNIIFVIVLILLLFKYNSFNLVSLLNASSGIASSWFLLNTKCSRLDRSWNQAVSTTLSLLSLKSIRFSSFKPRNASFGIDANLLLANSRYCKLVHFSKAEASTDNSKFSKQLNPLKLLPEFSKNFVLSTFVFVLINSTWSISYLVAFWSSFGNFATEPPKNCTYSTLFGESLEGLAEIVKMSFDNCSWSFISQDQHCLVLKLVSEFQQATVYSNFPHSTSLPRAATHNVSKVINLKNTSISINFFQS